MKNIKRTLTIGFIWSLLILGWWFPSFTKINWGFNPYVFSDWAYIKQEFNSGWILNTAGDWFFFAAMVLIIPFWIMGWRLCLRVQWQKMVKTIFTKTLYFLRAKTTIKSKKTKFKPKPSHKKVRPRPMNATAKEIKQTLKESSNKAPQTTPSAPIPSQNHTPSFLTEEEFAMPLEDVVLPKMERLEENLLATLQQAGYTIIQGPTIGKQQFDYLALDQEKILFCLVDDEKGDWLVEEEDNFGEGAPLWFSETSHRSSPIFAMADAIRSFGEKIAKRNLNYKLVPIFIEKAGNIINADEMAPVWKKLGVTVCRTDLGGPTELPGFTESVPTAAHKIQEKDIAEIQNLL